MSSINTESVEFALKIFKLISNEKNSVFSPFSLTTCLSMVLMGTQNTSANELSNSLFGKLIEHKNYELLGQQINKLMANCLEQNSGAMISTNLMYSDSKFEILSQFKQIIQKYFSANIKELDFKDKNLSLNVINDDIRNATKGKIDKLLDDIEDTTVVILANALYFKGLWKTKFIKENTTADKFTLNSGQQIDVQMMFANRKFPFGWSQQLKAKAIQIDYQNTNAVMIVLLPDTDQTLDQLKNNLTVNLINELTQSLRSVKVDLWLPKFKIESTFDLIPQLKNIGINGVFTKDADFSGLSQQKGLYISQVIQKAIIEVNEEGTEAAAVTAVAINLMSMDFNEEFRANRPFIYLLATKTENQQIDTILFIGNCINPNL